MNLSSRKWSILFIVVIIVVLLDQLTKTRIVHLLEMGETIKPIPVLVPFFQITRSANSGVAFGLFQDIGNVFLVIAVIIIGFMLLYYPRIKPNTWLTRIAVGLVIGGAIGNVIDRIRFNEVIDFIHYQIPGVISNVSNLADHAIVLGVLLLLADSWLRERAAKRAAMNPDVDP